MPTHGMSFLTLLWILSLKHSTGSGMCKTLKVEVPSSSHIPLTPKGLAGGPGGRAPWGFWVWSSFKSQTKRICTFSPTIIFRTCHALHRLRKIFNMGGGAEATASEASRPSACVRCSQGSRGLWGCKGAATLAWKILYLVS